MAADMTTFLGLDTSDFAQGLKRARTLADGEGGKLQQAMGRQQRNLEKIFLGGNVFRGAAVGPAILFGTLTKAYADYAEKFAFAKRMGDELGKSSMAVWSTVGRAATLLFSTISSQGKSTFGQLNEWLQTFLDKWAEGGMSDLLDAEKNEKHTNALAEGGRMRRNLERDVLGASGDEKGVKLLEARIEREDALAEIEAKRTKGLLAAADASRLRALVEERYMLRTVPLQDEDPRQAWKNQQDKNAALRAQDEAVRKEREKAQRKQNQDDQIALQIDRQRDRIDAVRLQKQEAKASAMEAELDLYERISAIGDKLLTNEQYALAVQHARLDSAVRLEAKLRDMRDGRQEGSRQIASGLFSSGLEDQVFRRARNPGDEVYRQAQESLREQVKATEKLKMIEEATNALLEVARTRLGTARFS